MIETPMAVAVTHDHDPDVVVTMVAQEPIGAGPLGAEATGTTSASSRTLGIGRRLMRDRLVDDPDAIAAERIVQSLREGAFRLRAGRSVVLGSDLAGRIRHTSWPAVDVGGYVVRGRNRPGHRRRVPPVCSSPS